MYPRHDMAAGGFVRLVLLLLFSSSSLAQPPGGILEQELSAESRPVLNREQLLDFLPERGRFNFPAPFSTEAVRLTNASDCSGNDCIQDIGYSYWRNINFHVGRESMLIVVGMERTRGGGGLGLLEYNKRTEELTSLGPVFDPSSAFSWASGEGFYFSARLPTILYVFTGSRFMRYNVITREFATVFDVDSQFGRGHFIWQLHSSDNDLVHSATLRSLSNNAMLGCMVYREDTGQFNYFPKLGDYDECQIDKSGEWLVIKENLDGRDGEDNRIINLQSGEERVLYDRDGAGGHSDLGHGYMVAADNWGGNRGVIRLWDFNENPLRGVEVHANSPDHVSHSNARPGARPELQYACSSSVSRSATPEGNEIVCFRLDASGEVLVVAPVMTDLEKGRGNDYTKSPKGNLDITGEYFIWTSNAGGSRRDAFLVKIPAHRLFNASGIRSTTCGGGVPEPSPILTLLPSGFAPCPPVLGTGTVSGAMTTAVVRGGASDDGVLTYTTTISVPDFVMIQATIAPEPSHIGRAANVMVVVKDLNDGTSFSVDANGYPVAFRPGDGALAILQSIPALGVWNPVGIFNAFMNDRYKGALEIHVGYQLQSGGEIYFNTQPIALFLQ